MAQLKRQLAKIEGWGADLDPANRPAVPMEKPSEVLTPRGKVTVRQVPTVKIHKSIEHPDLTPVFGTSCPPSGLSGRLRDFAYRFSEGRMTHWLTLLLADRVNVVEGIVEDLRKGRVPNPIKERGWKSELTHASSARKRRGLLIAGVSFGAIGLAVILSRRLRENV